MRIIKVAELRLFRAVTGYRMNERKHNESIAELMGITDMNATVK
jgi:hypothetical protein